MVKTCKDCGETKSHEELAKDKRLKDGVKSLCKPCQNKRVRQWVTDNPERRKTHYTDWSHRNPEYVNQKNRDRRTRKREQADGYLPTRFKERVIRFYGSKCLKCESTENLTLDHIIPLIKGGRHAVRNMQVLCHSCNASKEARNTKDYRTGRLLMWFVPRGPVVVEGTQYIKVKETT